MITIGTVSEPTVMDVARVNVMHMNGTEILIIMVMLLAVCRGIF